MAVAPSRGFNGDIRTATLFQVRHDLLHNISEAPRDEEAQEWVRVRIKDSELACDIQNEWEN